LVESESDREKQVRKLLRVLRVHFNSQKQAIIGPDLSHRRTLIHTIIQTKEVREAIEIESTKKDQSFDLVEKTATKYANEIASHQTYRVIRFFQVLLRWLWNNLYDGIDLNNIERVKHLAQSHEIIYTPSHRSHIDYLLLSYVLYQNGLTPPHIAAGRNLDLPIVGSLLRRGGAFYMRRSFQGDALYKAVFDEYLHQMFIKGYSVEYFIEGSRSRTGRTLSPRTGMLNMTVHSFQKDSSNPICLMPVYFGYERVLESSTYLGELSGKDKRTESLFDILKIFRSLKYSFGKVTVNFGEPLLLAEFLDKEAPDWKTREKEPDLSKACSKLATELVTRINSATAVNVVALTATALLCTPKQTSEEKHLLNQLTLLTRIAQDLDYSDDYSITTLPAREILDSAISIAGLVREEHPFGVTIAAPKDLAVLLTYYSNNICQVYVLPSLIARFLKDEHTTNIPGVLNFCETIYPFLQSEYFLRWSKNEVAGKCLDMIRSFEANGLVALDRDTIVTASYGSDKYASLHELAEIVEPTLERFHIVLTLLIEGEDRSIRDLESDAAAIAEQLSAIYGINSPDFFERSLFTRFIRTLELNGLVSTSQHSESDQFDRKQHVIKQEKLFELAALTSKTLDADVQYNVLQAMPIRP
jgi:glycerol-3-phosphate O-acyltransferase